MEPSNMRCDVAELEKAGKERMEHMQGEKAWRL